MIIDSIWNFIKADKTWQWFFSGSGVLLFGYIIKIVFKKLKKNEENINDKIIITQNIKGNENKVVGGNYTENHTHYHTDGDDISKKY